MTPPDSARPWRASGATSVVSSTPSIVASPSTAAAADRPPAACAAGDHDARDRHPLRQLVQQDRQEEQHAQPAGHQEAAGDRHAVEEGVQGEPEERRDARGAAQSMGLLAEVEMGNEDVLRQMHRQVPAAARTPRRSGPSRNTSGSTPEHRHRQHEAGAEGEAGVDQPQLAPQVPHHRERPRHVAERRGQRERERRHPSSRARASSALPVLSDGSSSTRSSSAPSISPTRGAGGAELPDVVAADGEITAGERIAAARGSRAPSPPTRAPAVPQASRA